MKKSTLFLALAALFFLSTAFLPNSKDARKLPKPIRNNYTFIPAGEVIAGDEKSTLEAFYIFNTEVSNLNYLEFLFDLKLRGETEKLQIARVDSTKWLIDGTYTQPFVENYHRHPAYHDYPVVNVSLEGAKLYCKWLGETLTKNNPGFIFEARLPTRKEWIRAARPEQLNSLYSWSGPYLRRNDGAYHANFRNLGARDIHFDSKTNTYVVMPRDGRSYPPNTDDHAHITAPVKLFTPSAYGLYHMNGNVAELTAEGVACGGGWISPGYDIRNESVMEVEGASPFVGFRPLLTWREVE